MHAQLNSELGKQKGVLKKVRHLLSKRVTNRKKTGRHLSQAQQCSAAPLNLHTDTSLQETWAQGHDAASWSVQYLHAQPSVGSFEYFSEASQQPSAQNSI